MVLNPDKSDVIIIGTHQLSSYSSPGPEVWKRSTDMTLSFPFPFLPSWKLISWASPEFAEILLSRQSSAGEELLRKIRLRSLPQLAQKSNEHQGRHVLYFSAVALASRAALLIYSMTQPVDTCQSRPSTTTCRSAKEQTWRRVRVVFSDSPK